MLAVVEQVIGAVWPRSASISVSIGRTRRAGGYAGPKRRPGAPGPARPDQPTRPARRRRGSAAAAQVVTLSASRVLPTPGEPLSVTSRWPLRSLTTSAISASRPTKLLMSAGRLSRRPGMTAEASLPDVAGWARSDPAVISSRFLTRPACSCLLSPCLDRSTPSPWFGSVRPGRGISAAPRRQHAQRSIGRPTSRRSKASRRVQSRRVGSRYSLLVC